MFEKCEVIDRVWMYSRFYGNKLGDCERFYHDGDGYAALVLLFEVTENICKSFIGDYESSFYNIVEKLYNSKLITDNERNFLSEKSFSIRKIRNLFAHANLMCINIVQEESGHEIFYPLTEEDSCILLYEKISELLFNVLIYIGNEDFEYKDRIILGKKLKGFNIEIKEISAKENLKFHGFSDEDINKIAKTCDENTMMRLAENSSNVNILAAIFKSMM